MSRKFRTVLALLSFWMASSVALAGSQGKDGNPYKLEQSVFVYTYAQVPVNSLERAKREAARIFRQAGEEIV